MLPTLRSAAHLAWMRISEQPGRMAYLVATLAVAVLAWMVLAAFAAPFLASRAGAAINAELSIANGRVQGNPFPLRHALRIAQMPGVTGVVYQTLAAFQCREGRGLVTINAYGGTSVLSRLRSQGASETDLAAWSETRNGLLVGAGIAEKCGLRAGMILSPQDIMSGANIPVTIIGALPENRGSMSDQVAYGHYDYVNLLLPETRRDQVMRANVTGDDPAHLARLAQVIEQEFESSDPPLQANTSSGTDSALGRFGQVQALLGLIMAAMAACALLVFLTVLAHLVAQRRSSMAVLQTMGFGRSIQFTGLLMEFALVVLVGTAVGAVGGHALLAALTPKISWLLGQLRTPDWAVVGLLPALAVLSVAALAWPAIQLFRLRPIDHLRS